jgi:DnaJ family protein A protein 2
MQKYFSILGVKNDASADEIKKAYHVLAMKHHPDKGGDPDRFKDISRAYDEIQQYKKNPAANNHFHFNFQPNRSITPTPIKKNILQKTLVVPLSFAITGGEKKFSISSTDTCSACSSKCTQCQGSGSLIYTDLINTAQGTLKNVFTVACHTCKGKKIIVRKDMCTKCHRKRYMETQKIVKFDVKPFYNPGLYRVFPNVAENVDLKLFFQFEKSEFEPMNFGDLRLTHEISIVDAIFGKKFDIVHPSGKLIAIDTRNAGKVVTNESSLHIHGQGLKPGRHLNVIFNVVNKKRRMDVEIDPNDKVGFMQLFKKYYADD